MGRLRGSLAANEGDPRTAGLERYYTRFPPASGLPTRRVALKTIGAGSVAMLFGAKHRAKLPVAAVVTEYRTNSHADVIVGKILEGWRQDGGAGPDLELVSLYTDQVPHNDLSRQLAREHGFRIAETIDDAVTLGRNKLPVAGVLSIGEHGDYPLTADTKQRMYPRRRFFDEIVASMKRCDSFVPLFSDKHLAYRWQDAKHMVDTARLHKIPLMAGSSLPLAWRYPARELRVGAPIDEAVLVGYGGLESYGFHALESLQCIVERRQDGETGVAAVTALTGDQIWEAEKRRKWSRSLLESAMATFGGPAENLEQRLSDKQGAFYLVEYRDGLKATVAMLNGVSSQFAVACRLRGKQTPFACWFRLEEKKPYGHFEHLLRGIESMFHTRKPAYPVERNLLTTGILDRVMQSLQRQGRRLVSPELDVRYEPSSWGFANQDAENFPS